MRRIIPFLICVLIIVFMNIRCSENEQILIEDKDAGLKPKVDTSVVAENSDDQVIIGKVADSLRTGRVIYLTIDDAPINGSEYIDSVIFAEKVKVSLFFVGNAVNGSSRFLRYFKKFRENPYIEMYNHSYSHANNKYADFYKNPEQVLADFERNQSEFEIAHKIIRLPGRNLWMLDTRKKNCQQSGSTSAELLLKNGYKVYGWDVEWMYDKDYKPKQSIDELMKEIENSYTSPTTFTRNNVVLLLHNQMFGRLNEKNDLGLLIAKLKENNYSFEYLSSYPESTPD